MTREEAIEAMKEGKKVTHRFFTEDEFITMKDGMIIDEKGYKLNLTFFWAHRQSMDFDTDWSIYEG